MSLKRSSDTSFTLEEVDSSPVSSDMEPELALQLGLPLDLDSQVNQPNDSVYYPPGCYCTPQVVQHNHLAGGSTYLHDYQPQWNLCSPATYIVDAVGVVYYVSDFEYHLLLPNNVQTEQTTLQAETEITYQFPSDDDSSEVDFDDQDHSVSPRKKKRYNVEKNENAAGGDYSEELPSNVYRSEEGYLVEEPIEPEEDPSQKQK